MAQNVLITGAAGYIGGSVLADLLFHSNDTFKDTKFFAAVRAQEQAESVSKLGVDAVQVDLNDKAEVEEAVLRNQINIVIHTAGSMYPAMTTNLLAALGQRQRASGSKTYLIHSSVATMFMEEGGWPSGEVRDTDPLLSKEKEIGTANPVRHTNILLADEGKAQNVTTLNVAVPMVYGRGTGECRKLSVNIPAFVRTSIKLKTVYKFDVDASPAAVHISDLTSLYLLLLDKILRQEKVSTGENGYYFAIAHRAPWWKVMDGLAEGLYSRGLVTKPKVQVWPSYDEAADTMGFPRLYMQAIGTSSGNLIPENPLKLGWKPKWDEKRFLDSLDDEIEAVQQLDTVKMSLFDSLK
ncbi:hypothetical protein CEP54_015150 [Fusarium duplospermum]|uniref:NAD-dependent epimerase/dehydratase domain-containing protein n=1 Tax=Fusarium duplospermum TaxID=1325734 RepID=A0A428NR53_9HYPO|nr:hypothetical protein CEP54_015150 [Fusarium duplospermum]